MFLIDTNVLSALQKRERSPEVFQWISDQRRMDLYLSVVSVGEIQRGIAKQQRRDPPFACKLAVWLNTVIGSYGDRILAVDLSTARRWGRLSDEIGNKGDDLLIAATALEHDLTVVTRNVKHFQPTGVKVLNPSLPTAEE